MSVQVRDRRFKPLRWPVSRSRVRSDCQWAWDGLLIGLPMWLGGARGSESIGISEDDYEPDISPYKRHAYIVGTITTSLDYVGSVRGQVLRCTSAGTANYLSTNPAPELTAWTPTDAITIILHYRKTDTTNRATSPFGMIVGSPQYIDSALPYSDGVVYWDFGFNGFAAPNRLSVSGLSFGDDVWAFSNGPRGMEIWQNGIRRASGSQATRTASATDQLTLFRNAALGADLAEYGCFWLYGHQLSEAQISQFAIDPYIPIRPGRRFAAKVGSGGATAAGTTFQVPALIGV